MNQDSSSKLIDAICSICGCEDRGFLLNVFHGGKISRFCTSCVLVSHKECFCPTCFAVYDSTSPPPDTIRCNGCHSHSHSICFSSNCSSSKASLLCSSCRNPSRLTFTLRKVKAKRENNLGMDKKGAKLFLTAAKIAALSTGKAAEARKTCAELKAKEAVIATKKATDALYHVMEHEENSCKVVDNNMSLLDGFGSQSEEDNSPGTSRETGRLQRLTVMGAARNIDLNEECPSWNDDT